ncbi:MAG: polyprenyl synthetase family protein [Gammaproteobacteria bacterium]|nr:polyprenyl synthetase family protein [Gammaproteobacteria bacterium]MCY4211995.1 polyprenyl synthetase family protein [Gammaproteobacteria bacterium]MCY4283664.1 polyprenyl synthetase family protein [Gammaproteobacteria bacterium]MCY4338130.1 polyprenyl synthetase family protein [Gammaproteobacteria bacterium]
MQAVNALIQEKLHSEIGLIDQLGHYIVNSGGKRLRPALVLLSARCFGHCGNLHILLAAVVEFIHTATLLHDDVVDASKLRRGKATANQRWGNEASVLVGDFLYSCAFRMMVEAGNMRVMDIMAEATQTIAEGEVLQLTNRHDPDTTEQRYLQVISNKTAKLFEAAARVGAVVAGQNRDTEQALAAYGRRLGVAYQLIDDVLDYDAPSAVLGKNIGDDLAEGKPTLPLLYALWHCPEQQATLLKNAITRGSLENLEQVRAAITATGALEYTRNLAQQEAEHARNALAGLPRSDYLDALHTLARFAVERRY